MAIENRLKEIMKKKRITQKELAEKVGVSRQTIGHIVRGERLPSIDLAINISIYLRESIDTIFFKKDEIYEEYVRMFMSLKKLNKKQEEGIINEIEHQLYHNAIGEEFIEKYGMENLDYYNRVVASSKYLQNEIKEKIAKSK